MQRETARISKKKSDSSRRNRMKPTPQENILFLERLLAYELRAASRFRRFASLVMVTSAKQNVNLENLLSDCIRSSDEFVEFGEVSAILMGETDNMGAIVAVNRYKTTYGADLDLRYSVVSYPIDGKDANELLWTARSRLDQARNLHSGVVVSGN